MMVLYTPIQKNHFNLADQLQNDLPAGLCFLGVTLINAKDLLRPEDSAGTHIPSPTSTPGHPLRFRQVTLTHAQFCLRTLALGDVGYRSHELQAARLAPRGTRHHP